MSSAAPEMLQDVEPDNATAIAVGILENQQGEVLIGQRTKRQSWAGWWEFPGGKLEAGESPEQALSRELQEELGIRIGATEPLITLRHDYPEGPVCLHVRRVIDYAGEPRARERQSLDWIAIGRLPECRLLPADGPIVAALRLSPSYAFTPPDGVPGTSPTAGLVRLRTRQGSAAGDDAVRALVERGHAESYGVMLDGDPSQVMRCGAAGWHARAADLTRVKNRPVPGDRWFAASCHDQEEVRLAARAGTDLVVIGPVCPTASHPGHAGLGWKRFAQLARLARRPAYAIGGVGPADLARARDAGAQGVAGISAFWPGRA